MEVNGFSKQRLLSKAIPLLTVHDNAFESSGGCWFHTLPLITGTKKLFADFLYAAYISEVDTRVYETLETILNPFKSSSFLIVPNLFLEARDPNLGGAVNLAACLTAANTG